LFNVRLKLIPERFARFGAAMSHAVMWIAVGTMCSHVSAADGSGSVAGPVNQESIYVTLPMFVVSIIATAGFTWTIAKWDTRRTKEVHELRNEIAALKKAIVEQDRRERQHR
jgi:hypothetical protein